MAVRYVVIQNDIRKGSKTREGKNDILNN